MQLFVIHGYHIMVYNRIINIFKSKSIKGNYILNLLRVISAALVTIMTLPYITRTLGAENLGKVEYINTIINYFVLFSALGIPMYGIREISRNRDDKKALAKTLAELLLILLTTTVFSYLIIFGVLYQLNTFENYKNLIIVLSSMVFLTNIGAEWYFQGVENQLFITVRYVLVRIIVFGLIFLMIKNSADYIYYAVLLVLTACGANLINFIYIFKFIKSQKLVFKNLNIKRHIKPILTIFVATVSVNIYLQLDNLLIGSISGDKYVAYYAIANKLIRFVISFITIIGSVMLPRLSLLYLNDKIQYYIYLRKSFNILLLFSIPFTIFFYIFSQNIILLMAGKNYQDSVITMQILSPLCIIVSMAYFMGFLILYPQNREKVYTVATLISAVFSILINFYAIKKYQQNGAAIIALLSELIAISIMFYYTRKLNLLKNLFDKNLLKILYSGIGMFIFSYILNNYLLENWPFIVISLFSFSIYFILIILFNEKNSREIIEHLIKK
jgi:O-antigen/teichoic acid export membrane protein